VRRRKVGTEHLAIGLAAKPAAPQAPLVVLLAASEAPIWVAFPNLEPISPIPSSAASIILIWAMVYGLRLPLPTGPRWR
jgi:hypothetical protein